MNISHRHCHMSDYIEANVANNVALRGLAKLRPKVWTRQTTPGSQINKR